MARALTHLQQTQTQDQEQTLRNQETAKSVAETIDWLDRDTGSPGAPSEAGHKLGSNPLLVGGSGAYKYPADRALPKNPILSVLMTSSAAGIDYLRARYAKPMKHLIEQKFQWALTYREDSHRP